MKARPPVPAEIVDRVLFDSDLLCCVCHRRGHHIHHVDGNPGNNELSNLVLLCFEHHHEATVRAASRGAFHPAFYAAIGRTGTDVFEQ
jgi:5-methylcytosine-specific restriction endonuclease McrA